MKWIERQNKGGLLAGRGAPSRWRSAGALPALSLVLLAPAALAQTGAWQCGPAAFGAPCAQEGPATLPTGAGQNWAIGNPVHALTGRKHQRDIDLAAAPGELGLEVVRHYLSGDPRDVGLGPGWRWSYDARLYAVGSGWQVAQVDGSVIAFGAPATRDGLCLADDPAHGTLRPLAGGGHVWRWPNGRELRFDATGHLVAIQQHPAQRLEIQRGRIPGRPDFGRIVRVTDAQQRSWRAEYAAGGGVRLHTSVGTLRYVARADGLLRGVIDPLGRARLYLYQEPADSGERWTDGLPRLSGVVVLQPGQRPQRLWGWEYGEHGKVVRVHRALDAGAVVTRNLVVPDPLPSLDADATVQRDVLGRVAQVGEGERRMTLGWRGDGQQLAWIERPSGVAGQRQRLEILWRQVGAVWLPIQVVERGWWQTAADELPQPIRREWQLVWEEDAQAPRLSTVRRRPALAPSGSAAPPPAGDTQAAAWPALSIERDDLGQVRRWFSRVTGHQERTWQASAEQHEWHFANGTVWQWGFDTEGGVRAMQRRMPSQAPEVVELRRPGARQLQVLGHPEQQYWHWGEAEQDPWLERAVHRDALGSAPAWQMRERWQWRTEPRQLQHELPEGGSLIYQWQADGRLRGIHWQPAGAPAQTLLQATAVGYSLANQSEVIQQWGQSGLRALGHRRGEQWWLAQRLLHGPQGHLVREHIRIAGGKGRVRDYDYDQQGRLVQVGSDSGTGWALSWEPTGAARARWPLPPGAPTTTQGIPPEPAPAASRIMPKVVRDAAGLPRQVDDWSLTYGPNHRLLEARHPVLGTVRYGYNAQGEQIARVTAHSTEQYSYVGHQRVAKWAWQAGQWRLQHRYVYANEVLVAILDYGSPASSASGGVEVLTVHADALGQPKVITDASGRLRWRAEFDEWGRLLQQTGTWPLRARLPGQWEDALTGWHDNYQRTYDPRWGHYLEPDPLGPPGVQGSAAALTTPFGYAGQQPRRWVDPTGLVLFAFDGTLQTAANMANVYRLHLAYRDAQALAAGLASSYYRAGPGGWPLLDLDAALAISAPQIIEDQWQRLLGHLQVLAGQWQADPVTIDLLGYSRGAALARHFGNQIAAQVRHGRFWVHDPSLGAVTSCVDLRFMGLFDTVAQFGGLGQADGQFDFTLAPHWQGVAHAVALQERRWLYPLLSLADSEGRLPANAIELPFLGAHGDIGGGLVNLDNLAPGEHPLSDVALAWMAEQAEAMGVWFEADFTRWQAPDAWAWLHDLATPYERLSGWRNDQSDWPIPGVPDADRAVKAQDGSTWLATQGEHAILGRQARRDAETWIARLDRWLSHPAPQVGRVDLNDYARGLGSR